MANWQSIIRRFAEYEEKLASSPVLISVRRGLTMMIPLVLIGSLALVVISLPIPAYQNTMAVLFGGQWQNIFLYIRDGTFNIMSLIMVIAISYSYVMEYTSQNGQNASPIIAAVVSLSSFITILGMGKDNFTMATFGVTGIFVAIVVAISSAMLFLKLSTFKLLQIKALTDGGNPAFNFALAAIFPAGLTIAVYAVINQALEGFFGISNIQSFISGYFCGVFSRIDSPWWGGILFISLVHLFWALGMHGSNILEPVAQSFFVPALAVNQHLISAGRVPTEIFSKTFFDAFILMGGCGSTLCLIGAILIAGKHKNQIRLAKMSFIPVIFNINELIIFGVPIVLNPVYILPFLGVPVILTLVSALAMYAGLVPYTRNMVEWTTPIFLSGFTATGSLRGSMLQLFNLGLGTLCYIPFVKLAEGVADVQMKNNLDKLYAILRQGEERGTASTLLARYDDVGNIARFLAADLAHDLQNDQITLFYQPQVDYEGRVFGAEALLRWKHKSFGYIYPPLIIALAEESQLIDKLGGWIFDTACRDLHKMVQLGLQEIVVSVNISAVQLENDFFIKNLIETIKKRQINPANLNIEITEQLALTSSKKTFDQMIALKKMGIQLTMDDFGMGHSSLMYLKEYEFDTIKLDGCLVREILSNSNCSNIISSIVFLGKSLNYSIIAEYVEEEEQRKILHELGCSQYQGYLFSQAVPFHQLMEYIFKNDLNQWMDSPQRIDRPSA